MSNRISLVRDHQAAKAGMEEVIAHRKVSITSGPDQRHPTFQSEQRDELLLMGAKLASPRGAKGTAVA